MSRPEARSLRALPDCLHDEGPIAVRLIDLQQGEQELILPASVSGRPYRSLLALVQSDGRPLGWVDLPVPADGRVSLQGLLRLRDYQDPAQSTDQNGKGGAPIKTKRSTPALMSVVVTTCADVNRVLRCVDAIRACRDRALEIVIVENRPILSTLQRVIEDRFAEDPRVRYVEEHSRGLSRARNAGLSAARGEIVVFTDDDIVVDRAWARAIRTAFERSPSVDCVTGPILPLELETSSQVLVERFASFGKGFVERSYSIAEPPADQPLFPYTAGYFGSGANIAFRAQTIRGLRGFDPSLGVGTPSRAGEDLDVCIRLMHAGGRLAYVPGAMVWHPHPDTPERLRKQVFGYGVGLGAMLFKQLLLGVDRRSILARIPQGIRYFTDPRSRKNISRGSAFPASLNRLERIGLAYGPLAYLATRFGRG